ncbi:jg13938 [Pararge aegeria aegeria]|uniref:Jg13938 protein n=1 Tax=Pararge aegeria aegeria TaxID=348720 RepID=A0A8S4RT04_9NEOP|nr:jg13938 [Pararge aegeria aegeria]
MRECFDKGSCGCGEYANTRDRVAESSVRAARLTDGHTDSNIVFAVPSSGSSNATKPVELGIANTIILQR